MACSDPERPVGCLNEPHATHLYTGPCCKSSSLFSSFIQCTKETGGRKLCCNILKHQSCHQPVQGQYPVFLKHGSDSPEAAPIGLGLCFSKWFLNYMWSLAFTYPNTGCASGGCLCVQSLNQHVQLHVSAASPCSKFTLSQVVIFGFILFVTVIYFNLWIQIKLNLRLKYMLEAKGRDF